MTTHQPTPLTERLKAVWRVLKALDLTEAQWRRANELLLPELDAIETTIARQQTEYVAAAIQTAADTADLTQRQRGQLYRAIHGELQKLAHANGWDGDTNGH